MIFRMIALSSMVIVGGMVLMPRGTEQVQSAASSVSRPEMQLIASLRELAKAPVDAPASVILVQREAAAAEPLPPPVRTAAAETTADRSIERMIVTSSALNLRAAPSTDARVLGKLREGQAVEVGGRDGRWVEVATADGATGWAYSDYLAVATQ
jgi:uncharacterized protein YgiM (DUF1202 family)